MVSEITTTVTVEKVENSKKIKISEKCLKALDAEVGDYIEIHLKIIRSTEGSANKLRTKQEINKAIINAIDELSDQKNKVSIDMVLDYMKKEYKVDKKRTKKAIGELYRKGMINKPNDFLQLTNDY